MASRKKIADDEIWISMIFNDHMLNVGADFDRNQPGWAAYVKGESIPTEALPLRMYLKRSGVDPRKFRSIIHGPMLMFFPEVMHVLQQFDLGGSSFVPAQIYKSDRETKIEKQYFVWHQRPQKSAFLPAESRDIRLPDGRKPETTDYWGMPWEMKDLDIAVSRSALEGADMWMDKMAKGALFMKGKVVAALREADLTRSFRPKKCRVL